MKTIPLVDLIIPERQRKDYKPEHIKKLAQSILSKGLMHAPLISRKDDKFTLVAGGCRVRAMTQLHTDGHQFTYDNSPLSQDHIPYSEISDLSPGDLAEAELEENILRMELTWLERQDALILIHKLRQSQNPGQSVLATANELAEQTGKSVNAENIALHYALRIAEHRNDPRVLDSKSPKEAYRKIIDKETAEFQAELHKRGIVKSDHQVLEGNCLELMKTLPQGTFDLILTDPPYGIAADDMKKGSGHHYDDSVENALKICKAIISQGFHLLKPRGNLFLFCDIEHFLTLREFAKDQAYTVWRTPIIWTKGQEGSAPWGRLGFQRTYEVLLYLTKGEKGLKGGGPDVKDYRRTARNARKHAAEKPVALLQHLISLSCDPGDVILDPTCGSGPIFDAATLSKCRAVGIELDATYYSSAVARLVTGPQIEIEDEIDDDEVVEEELLA